LVRTALKEYEQATESFEKALSVNAAALEVGMYCGICYLLLGKYPEALEKLAQIQTKGFRNPDLDLWMGYAHLGMGRMETAERHFERAAMSMESNYLALDGWGLSLSAAGRHQEAAEKYKQCLTVMPNYALGQVHLARAVEAGGNAEVSRQIYRDALSKD